MHTIYALIDPRDNTPKYVGITDCPPFRLREHMRNLVGGKEKRAWIEELKQSGLVPSMEVLERVPTQELARQRERYWTRHYLELGMPLTNVKNASARNRAIRARALASGDEEWVTMTVAAEICDVDALAISRLAADGKIQVRGNRRDKRVRLVSVSELRAKLLEAPPRMGSSSASPIQDQGAQLVAMDVAARVFGVKVAIISRIAASKAIRTYENRRDMRVKLVSLSDLESYFGKAPHGPR